MTEICVQVFEDLEKIKSRIIKKGFEFLESYDNHDSYFTKLEENSIKTINYKQLLDNSIIVRNIVGKDLDIKNLVYKSKTLDEKGNVINEIKMKVNIDDVGKIKTMLKNIRLCCWCDYICQNYEFKKDEIILDVQYVKGLGTFIEIEEFDSIKKKTDKEKFTILTNIINSFDLPLGNDYSCKKPYIFLHKKQQID